MSDRHHPHPSWGSRCTRSKTNPANPQPDMYYRLMREIDQVLKLLAHVEAAALSGEQPSPLGSFGEHPAVQLYLGSTWATIVTVLDGHPVMPSKDDFAATDEAVRQAGAKAITDLCAVLGITAELRQEGVMHLNVTAPLAPRC